MFRKTYLAIASCAALVAFMGFSTNAFASHDVHDPNCDQYGNQVDIFEFSITTPDSNMAGEVSGVDGAARACGSNLETQFLSEFCIGGDETLYNHADVGVPPGVNIADSDLADGVGAYAGRATVNILYNQLGLACVFDDNVAIIVRTDDKAECIRERNQQTVGDTPQGEIVSCLRGSNDQGKNWSWSVRNAKTGKLSLTIGPMHTDVGIEPGLTYVNLELCDYYSDIGGWIELGTCGTEADGDQFQQKNGAYTEEGCSDGFRGIYTVTATMEGIGSEGGPVTPEASTCVEWVSDNVLGPKAPGPQVCPTPACKQ